MRRTQSLILLVLMTASLVSRSGIAAEQSHAGHAHGSNAAAATRPGVTSMDVYADGDHLHLLIADRQPTHPSELQYLRSDDGGVNWSQPHRVGEGQPSPDIAHRGMDVQIAAAGDRLVAAWTTFSQSSRFGRGPIATAISADGGKSWRAGPNPADDGADTDHAFIDIAADEGGAFHLVWLDARAGNKALLYARSTDGGATWSPNLVVKPNTCECCWNTIATAPGGKVFILFRDKNPRDMALARSDDGGKTWRSPVTVGGFGWDFDGCPHVGGGLAVEPTTTAATLHAVVWTGSTGAAGAYSLVSTDGGATWGDPLRLGSRESTHCDVACGGGTVAAVWDAFVDGSSAVFASTRRTGASAWSAPNRLSQGGASATHPRVVRTSAGFVVFWTEQADGNGAKWVARKL